MVSIDFFFLLSICILCIDNSGSSGTFPILVANNTSFMTEYMYI